MSLKYFVVIDFSKYTNYIYSLILDCGFTIVDLRFIDCGLTIVHLGFARCGRLWILD